LKGTLDYGLWYKNDNKFSLNAYIDVDWVGCVDDQRSTGRSAFFLGDRLASWFNKKQDSVSLSIAEVEYIIVASCYT
jgi:hypothetical protein